MDDDFDPESLRKHSFQVQETMHDIDVIKKSSIKARLRRIFSANGVYECIQPLFFLLYWHGLTPFYIKMDASGVRQLRHSFWGYLNVVVHLVVYSVCYTLTLLNNCETVAGYFFRSRVTYFGDFLQILNGFIGVTVIYLTAIIPKYYVQHSLHIMHVTDEQLKGVGVRIMYSKVLRFAYIYMSTLISVNLLYTIGSFQLLKNSNEHPSASLHVTFVMQHTVVQCAIVMFSCFTKMLTMRLNMLHKVSGVVG